MAEKDVKKKRVVTTSVPTIGIITDEELKQIQAEGAERGRWAMLVKAVKEDGKPRKVTGMTRGQIAALYRAASVAELGVKCSYRSGSVVIFPL